MTSQAPPSDAAEKDEIRQDDSEVESPQEFVREFTRRPDVREIVARLARLGSATGTADSRREPG